MANGDVEEWVAEVRDWLDETDAGGQEDEIKRRLLASMADTIEGWIDEGGVVQTSNWGDESLPDGAPEPPEHLNL